MRNKTTKELERELSATASLSRYLTRNKAAVLPDQELSAALTQVLQEKDMSRSEVIDRSGLNDIYVHQIFSGRRRPSRDKLLCLFFGMGLEVETAQRIMKSCGYAPLYVKNRRDAAILFSLRNSMTLRQCNDALFEVGEQILS